jgi:hypothetical protein
MPSSLKVAASHVQHAAIPSAANTEPHEESLRGNSELFSCLSIGFWLPVRRFAVKTIEKTVRTNKAGRECFSLPHATAIGLIYQIFSVQIERCMVGWDESLRDLKCRTVELCRNTCLKVMMCWIIDSGWCSPEVLREENILLKRI